MRNHPSQARKDFTLSSQSINHSFESNTIMLTPSINQATYTNQLQSAGDQHEKLVSRLWKDMGSSSNNLMHAAIGISGEAGELLDAIKKHWVYNKPIDLANIVEELGDIEFYMRTLRMQLNVSREYVLLQNIDKLNKRYPSGNYSDTQAQDRADKAAGDFNKSDENLTDLIEIDGPEIEAILNGERL